MKLPFFCLVVLAFVLSLSALPAGEVEPDVMQLAQKELKTQGFYQGPIDGVSRSQTAAAVRRFQLAKQLKVTGKLNRQTLLALGIHPQIHTSDSASATAIAFAEIFSGGPFVNQPLRTQREVYFTVQTVFQKAGYLNDENISDLPNSAFRKALRNWQKANKLQQTGRIDSQTAKALGLQ
ncbi:MAG: peptidoglycan-binding protein [Chthoniobacterales bacterium]